MSENNADVQWLRQMLADYRIAYDDHPVGRRIALNGFIHRLRQRAERAERILAALREPSEGVLRTVFIATFGDNPVHKEACLVATQNAIRAAVAAAEQEVGRE